MCSFKNVYLFHVVVSNMKTKARLLESFEINDKIFVTPYSPRVQFASNEDAGDKPRTHFGTIVLLMFGSKHVEDFQAKSNKLTFELQLEAQFVRCLVIFPNVNEAV